MCKSSGKRRASKKIIKTDKLIFRLKDLLDVETFLIAASPEYYNFLAYYANGMQGSLQ